MTADAVKIEGGFAEVGAGEWLMGRSQPVAFAGAAERRRRKGWRMCDRNRLSLVAVSGGAARCASSAAPFLTHIPCAAPVRAVSGKVLVAPAGSRTGSETVRVIPMSVKGSFCATSFGSGWIVAATAGRTSRIHVDDGGTLSVRPEALVAWTGPVPSGFCPKLGLWDILLPRAPRDLLLRFHGPCIVWIEGAGADAATGAKGVRAATYARGWR